jgi:uroporphyrinogen decarboxylase
MTCRDRFVEACHCRPVDRPPLWLMRQAGRALPEYRELKLKYSFLQLVKTPELATEVTLQPVRRFGFDAAILFSDILVVAEALGQPYRFRDTGGIHMDFPIRSVADLDRLEVKAVAERLQYMAQGLRLTRRALDGRVALLGFAGSPWTLANFMVEGGSAPGFTRARRLLEAEPALFHRLMETLAPAVTECLRLQVEAGVDAVQVFDTLGGTLTRERFWDASARWMKDIIVELGGATPVIVFSKGMNDSWETLVQTGARVLGVDWTVRLAEVRAQLPAQVGVQGNLDPALLSGPPERVRGAARDLLEEMRGCRGHIFNLGHGVPPDARLDSLEALAESVQNFA